MQEEVEFVLDVCKEKMEAAVKHLEKELIHIRAGKASPAMLDSVQVEYYGSHVPLNQGAAQSRCPSSPLAGRERNHACAKPLQLVAP